MTFADWVLLMFGAVVGTLQFALVWSIYDRTERINNQLDYLIHRDAMRELDAND